MERIWILVSTKSQTPGRVGRDFVVGRCESCCNTFQPFTRDIGKCQANNLCELTLIEKKAIYMSGSGLLQHIALDGMDVAKADVLALFFLKRLAKFLVDISKMR